MSNGAEPQGDRTREGFARVGAGVFDRAFAIKRSPCSLLYRSSRCSAPRPRPSPASSQVGLFRTRELHSANLNSFPKWRDMLARFERELSECTPDRCRLDEWQQLVASLHGRKAMAQLKLVNSAVNRHRYIEDWANWELADYWETPLQFLDRSGDCEDFAIAKYLALRAGGMPAEDMRIVIVRDTSAPSHACRPRRLCPQAGADPRQPLRRHRRGRRHRPLRTDLLDQRDRAGGCTAVDEGRVIRAARTC